MGSSIPIKDSRVLCPSTPAFQLGCVIIRRTSVGVKSSGGRSPFKNRAASSSVHGGVKVRAGLSDAWNWARGGADGCRRKHAEGVAPYRGRSNLVERKGWASNESCRDAIGPGKIDAPQYERKYIVDEQTDPKPRLGLRLALRTRLVKVSVH